MKIKIKGKVHPSPCSTTTETCCADLIVATLQLLPADILDVASLLPLSDQEVLSYLLSRSLLLASSWGAHRPPSSGCNCFECYTIYWLRWDSSPNRDLIHHVIDAFEDRLSSPSHPSSSDTLDGNCWRGRDRTVNCVKRERTDTDSHECGVDAACRREKKGDEENIVAEVLSPGNPVPASPRAGGGGLARKVLSDVLGILNSRLWNIWSPNV